MVDTDQSDPGETRKCTRLPWPYLLLIGSLLGLFAVVLFLKETENARQKVPDRLDFYLQLNIAPVVFSSLVGLFCWLLAPFFTKWRLVWKSIASLGAVALYVVLLRVCTTVIIAIFDLKVQ